MFKDEDPYVRQLFEKEVAKAGAKVLMPPMKELIAYEKDCKSDQSGSMPDCGRIPAVVGNTVK